MLVLHISVGCPFAHFNPVIRGLVPEPDILWLKGFRSVRLPKRFCSEIVRTIH